MMKTMDFFGLDLQQQQFDIDYYAGVLRFANINKTPNICMLTQKFHDKHPLVVIAKRQILLKQLKSLLNQKMLPYDTYWYRKENNISTDHDRLYGAEEKILHLALVIATGKLLRRLTQNHFRPTTETLRDSARGRFDCLWEILGHDTSDYILRYKQGDLTTHEHTTQTQHGSTTILEKLQFWKKKSA